MYLGVSKNIFVDKVVVGRLHKRYVKKSWLKKSYTVSVGKFSHFSQGTWFKLLEYIMKCLRLTEPQASGASCIDTFE